MNKRNLFGKALSGSKNLRFGEAVEQQRLSVFAYRGLKGAITYLCIPQSGSSWICKE